jgi:hypothetical protein
VIKNISGHGTEDYPDQDSFGFRTVAAQTFEVKRCVTSTRLRLKQRAQNVIATLSTLPRDHPLQRGSREDQKKSQAKEKPSKVSSRAKAVRTMDVEQLENNRPTTTRTIETACL